MSLVKYLPEGVILDEVQQGIADTFEEVAERLNNTSWFDSLKGSLFGTRCEKGIYLHGSVGRGKTMIMQGFYELLTVPKEMVHYQNFMQEIHKKLHNLQGKSSHKIIQQLASSIANRAKILCIDEFEIKDITDAMLIMRLFKYLLRNNVYIVLTTNTLPDNLYKDGLQRELFLPFIKKVNSKFKVMYLDSPTDYRFLKISGFSDRVLYPGQYSETEIAAKMEDIKYELMDEGGEYHKESIKVFGREVEFEKVHKDTLFVKFEELIEQDFGYADYVNICQYFKVIVLEDVPEIGELETDKATRFINFIDNAYFYKTLLFISLVKAPEEIYKKGHKLDEYKRTISRLVEMNSDEYTSASLDEYRKK